MGGDLSLDFYGGTAGAVWTGNDLDQMANTEPVLDLSGGPSKASRGSGPAMAWIGFAILLIALRLLVEWRGE